MKRFLFLDGSYWLLLTTLLVMVDLVLKGRLYFAMAGVGAVVAGFLATLSVGLVGQVVAFVAISAFLLWIARSRFFEMRAQTQEEVEKAFCWFKERSIIVVEEIGGRYQPGKVLVDSLVMPAVASVEVPVGTRVEVIEVRPKELFVCPL